MAKEIGAPELKRRLEGGEPVWLLDIRERDDYADWHIQGSVNLPVYEALRAGSTRPLLDRVGEIPRDRPVVAVCRRGVVSRHAASVLASLGYDITSLAGGMRAWGGVWSEALVPFSRKDVTFVQVRRNGKGCLSYVLGSGGESVVVDPSVEAPAYVGIARREGLEIKVVLETHVHADHLSRARELSRQTGARLVLPANRRVTFPFEPLADGETLAVGSLVLEAMATPGHTGESTSYLLGEEALLTGDTLFVDAVGRPDLEKGDEGSESAARMLHGSLRKIVDRCSASARVLPAHHGRPVGFDGAPVIASLGELRGKLDLLRLDEGAFVLRVLEGLTAKPPNFKAILAVNEGRAELGDLDPLDVEAGPNRCAAG